MKFNWGTGILIFLILFLLASAGIIIFSLTQEVNLVHKDYYEKGVDHTEQMRIAERSAPFENALQVGYSDEMVRITFEASVSARIDSGTVLLYRPSSSRDDLSFSLESRSQGIEIPKNGLLKGRYILKFTWYAGGLKYSLDKPININ